MYLMAWSPWVMIAAFHGIKKQCCDVWASMISWLLCVETTVCHWYLYDSVRTTLYYNCTWCKASVYTVYIVILGVKEVQNWHEHNVIHDIIISSNYIKSSQPEDQHVVYLTAVNTELHKDGIWKSWDVTASSVFISHKCCFWNHS